MDKESRRVTSSKNLDTLLNRMEKFHHIKDLHSLLDEILSEARSLTHADAGSIFLLEDQSLKFSFVQNDTLFKNNILSNKYIYTRNTVTIDTSSLAGYVAKTGKPLSIKDAHGIDPDAPYSFNPYFDDISNYRTKSMLIVPLKSSTREIVGVMELINSKSANGRTIPFSKSFQFFVSQFAFYAAVAIERAMVMRAMVLKMIKIAELRDPEETQEHVYRVASYSYEIYQKWARMHRVPEVEVKKYGDVLRIAAMLHDVGKVGISDKILKKPGKLTGDEFAIVKNHSLYGARLFDTSNSEWESMAYEVSLNHHECWDGSGYPGMIPDLSAEPPTTGKGKKRDEIPLSARIVALADVYDALISKRVYKDSWEEEKTLHYIQEKSGKQFEPELVEIFMEIYDTIKAIRDKWSS